MYTHICVYIYIYIYIYTTTTTTSTNDAGTKGPSRLSQAQARGEDPRRRYMLS